MYQDIRSKNVILPTLLFYFFFLNLFSTLIAWVLTVFTNFDHLSWMIMNHVSCHLYRRRVQMQPTFTNDKKVLHIHVQMYYKSVNGRNCCILGTLYFTSKRCKFDIFKIAAFWGTLFFTSKKVQI